MPDPIRLPDAPEASVSVDLGGRIFAVRPFTRSLQDKLDAADKLIDAAETADAVAEGCCELVDALLTPTGEQRKTAKAVLLELWQADSLSISQLQILAQQIQQAATDDRPT